MVKLGKILCEIPNKLIVESDISHSMNKGVQVKWKSMKTKLEPVMRSKGPFDQIYDFLKQIEEFQKILTITDFGESLQIQNKYH